MQNLNKKRFIIVGSGWRSLFFVRIAKALPDVFELCAMLCRSDEKAERMARENDIYTTTSIEECRAMNPDFVVVAVNKTSIADVSKEWMNYGFTVLCETPAALDTDTLNELWQIHNQGGRLVVAEQYVYDPVYSAQLKVINSGLIGEASYLNISLAHEYHGASLMRAYLGETASMPFTVSAKTYEFPTVETMTRYEKITDGRVSNMKRTVGVFEFADGKVSVYDFDSQQYRSPIRNNYVKLQGVRGEMKDNVFYWLDDKNELKISKLCIDERRDIKENDEINITDGKVVYKSVFGKRDISYGEYAVAMLMLKASEYERTSATESLRDALQDAYMAILMKQAVESGEMVKSQIQTWHKIEEKNVT